MQYVAIKLVRFWNYISIKGQTVTIHCGWQKNIL